MAKWQPPRGIRLLEMPGCPNQPFGVQWRQDGRRKTKSFRSAEAQVGFAKALAADARNIGTAAFRLDESEAREWRAFVAQLGQDASLPAVLACWNRYGKAREALSAADAVAAYLAAKEAEGVGAASLAHYRKTLGRLTARMGSTDVSKVTREQVADWLGSLGLADWSIRTHRRDAAALFSWLVKTRALAESPCDGLAPVRIIAKDAEILTVEQGRALFEKSMAEPPELLGRLALEAFAGLRFGSASEIAPEDINWTARGIQLPADRIKTRKRVFITRLPDNLWRWLGRSFVFGPWSMTPRQYLEAKSDAFTRANIPHPRNCLRHSAATYLVARDGEVGKAATMLCNSEKMIRQHYLGRATEPDGRSWFGIEP